MALEIEDGSGKSNAQCYISASDCGTYLTSMGHADFAAASTTVQEAALLRAMRYLEGNYRLRWCGQKASSDQRLSWPRSGVTDEDGYAVDDDEIPEILKNALCEAAYREFLTTDTMDADLERGGQIKFEKIGPIQTEYQDDARGDTSYPTIEKMLAPYLASGSNSISVPVVRT